MSHPSDVHGTDSVEIRDSHTLYALLGGLTDLLATLSVVSLGLGPVGLIVFGGHTVWSLSRLLGRRVRLRITAQGIIDKNFWYSLGLIEWDEILDIRVTRWGLIKIDFVDEQAFLEGSPLVALTEMSRQLYDLGPALITPWGLKGSRRELSETLVTAMDSYALSKIRRGEALGPGGAEALPYDDRMDTLYFAYGSNMCFQRLEARVPGVRVLGSALLRGYELRWHKKGDDGSAKCSILHVGGDAVVHGALFAIPRREKPALDRAEGSGYNDILVSLESTLGDVTAKTYVADQSTIDDTRQPYSWYKALIVSGAESLGLPHAYVEILRLVDAVDDPDAEREQKHRAFLRWGGSG